MFGPCPALGSHADLGLWCGPAAVNLKKGKESLGAYGYEAVLGRLKTELDAIMGGGGREPLGRRSLGTLDDCG